MPRITSLEDSAIKPNVGIYSYASNGSRNIVGQFEFDVSSFRDPLGQKQFLTKSSGIDPEVRDWVGQDHRVPILIKECRMLAEDLIRHKKDGQAAPSTWLSFSFKDFHGKWISPAVAELVADELSNAGFMVTVYHSAIKKDGIVR